MPERGRARDRTGGYAGTWPQRKAVAASPSQAPSGTLPTLVARLRAWARAEAGAGRLLPWVPVAFGAGIAFYFSADHEPIAWVTAVVAGILCVAALLLRQHRLFPAAVMIAAMAAGFAVATVNTARVAHAVLTRPMYSPLLKGFVETREVRERTDRFVLRVVRMDDPWRHVKLDRVRLSVRKGTAPAVGSFVELKARLQPPLTPVRPGSYDFARDMYFQGIGASGFVMGPDIEIANTVSMAVNTFEKCYASTWPATTRSCHLLTSLTDRSSIHSPTSAWDAWYSSPTGTIGPLLKSFVPITGSRTSKRCSRISKTPCISGCGPNITGLTRSYTSMSSPASWVTCLHAPYSCVHNTSTFPMQAWRASWTHSLRSAASPWLVPPPARTHAHLHATGASR